MASACVPALMDPTIEWVNPPYAVEPGTRRGYDGFAGVRGVRDVDGDYEIFGARVPRRRQPDPGASTSRWSHHRQAVPIDAEQDMSSTSERARSIRFRWFNDPAEALKAVGLEE